jgi:hypothetical protein
MALWIINADWLRAVLIYNTVICNWCCPLILIIYIIKNETFSVLINTVVISRFMEIVLKN